MGLAMACVSDILDKSRRTSGSIFTIVSLVSRVKIVNALM